MATTLYVNHCGSLFRVDLVKSVEDVTFLIIIRYIFKYIRLAVTLKINYARRYRQRHDSFERDSSFEKYVLDGSFDRKLGRLLRFATTFVPFKSRQMRKEKARR